MTNEEIAKKVHSLVSGRLRDVSFDKGLPELRKVLWEIADELNIDGAEVFKIYMDWFSKQQNK